MRALVAGMRRAWLQRCRAAAERRRAARAEVEAAFADWLRAFDGRPRGGWTVAGYAAGLLREKAALDRLTRLIETMRGDCLPVK
jgi:hypothetical protein